MAINTLDQWSNTTPEKKPVVMSDEHAHYLHEKSFGRQLDKLYDMQFERKIAEDKAKDENHKKYVGNNYVRIGGR